MMTVIIAWLALCLGFVFGAWWGGINSDCDGCIKHFDDEEEVKKND